MNIQLQRPKVWLHWAQIHRLYRVAFPLAERKPFSMIRSMTRKGKTDTWRLMNDGKFVGLGITINGPELILLDYFAIKENCRGKGLGTASLKALMNHYHDKGFFLEIESTLEDAPNKAQRQRRKRFYLSCGLEELGVQAELFTVNMEMLGVRCSLDYPQYRNFYRDNYNQWAADHIFPVKEQ